MNGSHANALARLLRVGSRRCRALRDAVEWHGDRLLRHRNPWCRNRWGQRYQAISLTEYHYLRDGNPETYEAALLARLLRPGMTVVDVGANHGMFTLEAAHHLGGSGIIHAFEPAPATRAVLERNLLANRLDRVRVFGAALGDRVGTASLRVHREWSGLNTLADRDITWLGRRLRADAVLSIPLTTLDAHARAERLGRIDFLKIDVEGFELAVLRGSRDLLARRRVRWILLEVGDGTCANARVEPAATLVELHELGYVLHAITPGGAVGECIEAFPTGPFSANYLAFPREDG